jgi:hypothetical protein
MDVDEKKFDTRRIDPHAVRSRGGGQRGARRGGPLRLKVIVLHAVDRAARQLSSIAGTCWSRTRFIEHQDKASTGSVVPPVASFPVWPRLCTVEGTRVYRRRTKTRAEKIQKDDRDAAPAALGDGAQRPRANAAGWDPSPDHLAQGTTRTSWHSTRHQLQRSSARR